MSQSNKIVTLEIGSTELTGKGIKSIVKMSQLKSLDIWATHTSEFDLIHLIKLQDLEYLSLSGIEGLTSLCYERIKSVLNELPDLKRLWLDGIDLTGDETSEFESRYEYFRH